jgi:AsmA protein
MVISGDNLFTGNLNIDSLSYKITTDNGAYTIIPNSQNETGKIFITPFASTKKINVDYKILNIELKDLFKAFNSDVFIDGNINITTKLSGSVNNTGKLLKTLNGDVFINGNELFLYGINLDDFLKRVERSQNFTFADLGAVLLMGPLGIVVTKGTDFTRVLMTNTKDTTHIHQITSDWTINGEGKYKISDVALSTDNNLIAAKGYFDLTTDSLNFTFAAVDDKGCKILSQKIKGNIKNPNITEIKIISSAIIAPVTNLFKDINTTNCKPFYKGKVKYPEKKK